MTSTDALPPPPPATAGAVHLERPVLHALPPNVTYRNLIAENKRKSALLVFLLIGVAIATGAAAGVLLGASGNGRAALPAAIGGAVIFGAIASIATAWSWFSGPGAILSMAGATPIEKSDDPQLFNVVEELAISAGLPPPKVYLIDDPSLNAFATGRDPSNAAVAITTGLRASLSRDELAGVMAHELSHVRHHDIRLMMLMVTLAGLIVFVGGFARNMRFYGGVGGGRRSSGNREGGNPLAIVLILLSVVILIVAPIIATVIRLAISRQREYLADAGAVELTRYPEGLIGALTKLGACRTPLKRQNDAIAPLFMVNPAKNAVALGRQDTSSMLLTHPPLTERIARLQALL